MKKIIALIILLLVLGMVSCSSPQFIEEKLSLEVNGHYFESQTQSYAPGILITMGGSGYNTAYNDFAEALAKEGYYVLLVDHYGGGDDWGGNGLDSDDDIFGYHKNAEEALQYLLTQEEVNKDKIAIVGFSYGSMLAYNLAYKYEEVGAVVDIYGYMEIYEGLNVSEEDFVTSLPPICIIHGAKDTTVKIERSEEIADTLNKYNIICEYNILPEAEHAFVYATSDEEVKFRDEAIGITLAFLDKYLNLHTSLE